MACLRLTYHLSKGALGESAFFLWGDQVKKDLAQKNRVNYFTFGMLMPGRHNNESNYRYGAANGQEKVDEISGSGNHYTAPYWEYDPRLVRRWNQDPVVKEHESPYACYANNPIWFVDPNGADTSNIVNSLKAAGFNDAMQSVNNSPTYTEFFQSFVDGANKNITLEFQSVKDLTSYDTGESIDGQALLFYDGNHVGDDGFTLPVDADVAKFKIVVQLNSTLTKKEDGSIYQTDELNAVKGITITHEMLVHALSDVTMINKFEAGTMSGAQLISQYNSSLDHDNLYSGKCHMFMTAADEIIRSVGSLPSTFYAAYKPASYAIDKKYLSLDTQQKSYFKNKEMYVRLNTSQMWKYLFRNNWTKPPTPE